MNASGGASAPERGVSLQSLVAAFEPPKPCLEDISASRGAIHHKARMCAPCQFFQSRRGCKDGAQCRLCHAPHENMTVSAARKAARKSAMEAAELQGDLRVPPRRREYRLHQHHPQHSLSQLLDPEPNHHHLPGDVPPVPAPAPQHPHDILPPRVGIAADHVSLASLVAASASSALSSVVAASVPEPQIRLQAVTAAYSAINLTCVISL